MKLRQLQPSSFNEAARALKGCAHVTLAAYLTPAGAELQSALTALSLARSGIRTGVILWSPTPADVYVSLLADAGIPVVSPPQYFGAVGKIRWLRRLMVGTRPRVLHSMAFFLNAPAAFAMKGVEGIAVGCIRGEYSFEARRGHVHYAVNRRWPSTLIANSRCAYEAALSDRSAFRPRRVLFVPNGLDLSQYTVRRHSSVRRPRVVGIGNLTKSKRWDRLVRVAARVRHSHPDLAFVIEVAGAAREIPGGVVELHRLQALAGDAGLSDRVRFLGRCLQVPQLLSQCDISVLLSDSEGTPNAVMEAMAAGLPVLASAVGDIPRLIQDDVHGYVVPPNDEDTMAERLIQLLCDSDLRARMGRKGRERAEADFGLDRLCSNLLDAYREAGWPGE